MKRMFCRTIALACVMALLLCGGSVFTVSAVPEQYTKWWKVFPPEEYGEISISVNAGKTHSTSYSRCDVQLPADVDDEFLALYIRATVDQPMAVALNSGGEVELGHSMSAGSGKITWGTDSVKWKKGLNEVYFPFAYGSSVGVDLSSKMDWFKLSSGELLNNGSITYHEVAVVDIAEGGITFGADDSYLQMTEPLSATPNTIEVSVKMDPTVSLSQRRYTVFSNRGADEHPIALSVTGVGAVDFQWDTTIFTVLCDVRTGDWVDIAVVRDMTDKKFYVYLDGEKKASFDATGTADILPAEPHCIAADADGTAVFAGGIADIRVWNDVRTQKEIQDNRINKIGNHANKIAQDAQGLLGNWYIMGDANFVVDVHKDASVYKNDLTFRGSRADDWLDYDKTQYDFLYDENGDENYYSMVVIPDIQNMVNNSYADEWVQAAQWIADNVDTENIVHVMGMGDSSWTTSWNELNNARAGYDRFTNLVSWNNVPGNHDYHWNLDYRDSSIYSQVFSEEYLNTTASKGVYQGYFEDPYGRSTVENSYYLFGVNGVRWMVLQLEFIPRLHVLEWADALLQQYSDYNVIITTHGYLNGDGSYTGSNMQYTANDPEEGGALGSAQTLWDRLITNNDNVKMVLCGHNRDSEGSVVWRVDENEAGNKIPQMMFNAQSLDVGDSYSASYFINKPMAMLGILRFSADGTQCAVQYYAPLYDKSYHPASNAITFEMEITAATDCMHTTTKEKVVKATCGKAGTRKTLCAECGFVLKEESVPQLTDHTWDNGVVTKEPVGGVKGEKTFTCTVCGEIRTEEVTALTPGDVNGDSKVDSTDARITLQYAVGKIKDAALNKAAADVNGDGKVDSTDARLILQYAVGKIQTFSAKMP